MDERIASDGQVVVPLDIESVDRAGDALVAAGVEAIAVCFINAYLNPAHERATVERLRDRHPSIPVCASTELVTEPREYERTSTAALNAYIQPRLAAYLEGLEGGLSDAGFDGSLAVMQSNGGVMSAGSAARRPIRTLLSGPAGGVIGVQSLADRMGLRNVICADVGGTTYDVALIEDLQVLEASETTVEAGRSSVR